jgi:hypothetical protein
MVEKNLLTLVLNFDENRKERLKILGPEWPRKGDYLNLVEKIDGKEITKKYIVERIEYTTAPFETEDEIHLARCDVYLKRVE